MNSDNWSRAPNYIGRFLYMRLHKEVLVKLAGML
jgi:hypothetical protein